MVLNVAMQQPCTRVITVVPNGHPRLRVLRGVGGEGVSVGRRVKVEALGLVGVRLGDGGVRERAIGLADQEHLVAVLVDGVLGLWVGGRHEDDVDPGVVERGQGDVVLDEGHGVQEYRGLGVGQRVDAVVERPEVRLAGDEHVEDEGLVGVVGGHDGRVRFLHGLVVVDDIGRRVDTHVVDVRRRLDGGGRLAGRVVRDVREVGDGLGGCVGGHAQGEVAELGQLDEHGEPGAVVDGDGIDEHGLNVGAVDGVQVHGVVVDGDVGGEETESADQIQGHPVAGRVVLDKVDGGLGARGGVAHVEDVVGDGGVVLDDLRRQKGHHLGGETALGGELRQVGLSQRALLGGARQGIDVALVPAVDVALAVDENRVVARKRDARRNLVVLTVLRGVAVPVGQQDGRDVVGGGRDGVERGGVRRDQAEGRGFQTVRVDRDGTEEAVVDLCSEMGVVPEGAVLGGCPLGEEGFAWWDGSAADTGGSVRPRSAVLFDACCLCVSQKCPKISVNRERLPWKWMVMSNGELLVMKTCTVSPCVISNRGPGNWPFT